MKLIISSSRRRTPWTDSQEKSPVQGYLDDYAEESYELKHGSLNDYSERKLLNSFVPGQCPHCGNPRFKKSGRTKNGIQRYQCLNEECRKTFTALTGTLLENHKILIQEWMDFLLGMIGFESFSALSKNNRNAYSTTKYWINKVFLALEDYQKDIILKGCVWIDETYVSVISREIKRKPDGHEYRGTSVNKIRIGIGRDRDRICCFVEGKGRCTIRSTSAAFKDHIKPRSLLFHDGEHSHKAIVKDLELVSLVWNTSELKGLKDEDNPLDRINDACAFLRKFLRAHSGFNRDDLQCLLNLFCFIMNEGDEPYEKVEKLLIRILEIPKSLKYRDQWANKRPN